MGKIQNTIPKIEIITHSYPPDFGAAPFLFRDLAVFLKEQNYDVEVITAIPYYPVGKNHVKSIKDLFYTSIINDIPVRRHWLYSTYLNTNILSRLASMFSLSVSMLQSFWHVLKRKPDIIIVQTPPIATPLPAIIFSFFTKAKLIVNVSDLWPHAMADLGIIEESSITYKLLEKLQQIVYEKADYLLAQSEEIQSYIEKKGFKKNLLFRVGVNSNLFKPNTLTSSNTALKIVYTGVLNVAHGIFKLCKKVNFQSLGIELHIYGDGSEKSKIKQYISENPEKGIFLHPVVSQKDIAEILPQYNAVLINQTTSIRGTLPAKIYEAMSAGVPILFNGGGEGARLIRGKNCGLISSPANTEELKNNLTKLKNMSENGLRQLGANGRKAAKTEFDRRIQFNNLLRLIKKRL